MQPILGGRKRGDPVPTTQKLIAKGPSGQLPIETETNGRFENFKSFANSKCLGFTVRFFTGLSFKA